MTHCEGETLVTEDQEKKNYSNSKFKKIKIKKNFMTFEAENTFFKQGFLDGCLFVC